MNSPAAETADTDGVTIGLDPSWVAEQLAAGIGRPSSIEFVGFIGTGQMSRTARYSLSWHDSDGPATVVVKMPSSEPGTRASAFQFGPYRKECAFYQSVLPLVEVTAPAPYAVHYDEPGQDFAIVLDDLVGSAQGDQFSEPTPDQLALAIPEAVALQAPVWGATDIEALAGYRVNAQDQATAARRVPDFLPTVFERLGSGLDDEIIRLLERFSDASEDWSRARAVFTTLVHGDFRPDNFLFGVEASAPPLAIVDWQTLGLGLGVTDVSYLLGGALEPGNRAGVERDLLGLYCELLARRGVAYPMDQCLSDYAIGALHGVVIAIAATTLADRTERGDALFTLMLNRHGRHALEWRALDEVAVRS